MPEHYKYIASLYSTDVYIKDAIHHNKSKELIHILETAREYIFNIQDDEFDLYVHNLMVNEITKIRPDAILVPCFQNSWTDLGDTIPLLRINEEEKKKKK